MLIAMIAKADETLTIEALSVSSPTTIDWGDGQSDEYSKMSRPTHQYMAAGEYVINFLQPDNVKALIIRDQKIMEPHTALAWRPFQADDGETIQFHYTPMGLTPLPRRWYSPKEAAQIKGVTLNSLLRLLRDERRRAAFFPSAIIRGEGRRREYRLHPDDVLLWKPRSRA